MFSQQERISLDFRCVAVCTTTLEDLPPNTPGKNISFTKSKDVADEISFLAQTTHPRKPVPFPHSCPFRNSQEQAVRFLHIKFQTVCVFLSFDFHVSGKCTNTTFFGTLEG